MKTKDFFGNPISVGDNVLFSTQEGNYKGEVSSTDNGIIDIVFEGKSFRGHSHDVIKVFGVANVNEPSRIKENSPTPKQHS